MLVASLLRLEGKFDLVSCFSAGAELQPGVVLSGNWDASKAEPTSELGQSGSTPSESELISSHVMLASKLAAFNNEVK